MPISTADEGGETWKFRRREGRGVKGSRDELARRDGKSDIIVSIDVAEYECMRGSCRSANFEILKMAQESYWLGSSVLQS